MFSFQKITMAATLCFSLTPNFAIAQETSPVRPVPRPEAPLIPEKFNAHENEQIKLLRVQNTDIAHCEDIPVNKLGEIACKL